MKDRISKVSNAGLITTRVVSGLIYVTDTKRQFQRVGELFHDCADKYCERHRRNAG